MSVLVERLDLKCDARGSVCEPLDEAGFRCQKNVHVVVTRPGGIRGNHRHRLATEIVTVYGPGLVRVREPDRVVDHEVPAGQAWRFTIPPGVAHAFLANGAEPSLLIAFSTLPHDPQNPDTIRDILIP